MDKREDVEGATRAQTGRQYVTPQVTWLGTLAELTHGGSAGVSDGTGSSGSSGSI